MLYSLKPPNSLKEVGTIIYPHFTDEAMEALVSEGKGWSQECNKPGFGSELLTTKHMIVTLRDPKRHPYKEFFKIIERRVFFQLGTMERMRAMSGKTS